MRLILVVSLFCCLLPGAASAQGNTMPDPTQLELWLRHPGTRITWSGEVGRINSTDAQAVVTALVIQNAKIESNQLRGVRVDLWDAVSMDRIYVDEGNLIVRKNELDQIDHALHRIRNEADGPHHFHGPSRCRPSQTIPQAICPSYYIGPETKALRLSTFSGHTYSFPAQLPSALLEAIGRAMNEFGLNDNIPVRPIALPADDIDRIAASAVEHFPELVASPGIRIADYMDEETKDSAAVIFWPYERTGDIAYSRLVYCETSGGGQKDWNCDRSDPRAYLKIHDQDKEVVIRGPVEREKALALIEFAKLRLQDETICTDMDQSEFLTLDPPTPRRDAYRIVWADGASGAIVFLVKEVPQDADAGFELVSISRSARGHCEK